MSIKLSGFKPYKPLERRRRVVNVIGLPKTGKTHFACTTPGPIVYFNFDRGEEGVLDKFVDGTLDSKEIVTKVYEMPKEILLRIEDNMDHYLTIWREFVNDYRAVLQNKDVRSIIIDTETELWEIMRMARLGKMAQVMPTKYGPVNAEFECSLKGVLDTDKNLILIDKLVPEYVNDKPTGKLKRSGYSKLDFVAQDQIRLDREELSPDIVGTVVYSKKNLEVIGRTFEGPLLTFPFIMADIHGTDPEEWMS